MTDNHLINTVNNDLESLVALQETPQKKTARRVFIASLQTVAIKEMLVVLNDTEIINALADALERGDYQTAMDAVAKILRRINLVWRLDNSWENLAKQPFSLDSKGLGIEEIMKDAHIFVGMFETLLKEGINYDATPSVGENLSRLMPLGDKVLDKFKDLGAKFGNVYEGLEKYHRRMKK